MDKLKILDLYCGLGGWSKGFSAAGYEPTGVDIVDVGYPYKLILADITKTHPKYYGSDYYMIIGSPECRDFSRCTTFGKYYWKVPPDPTGRGMEMVNAFMSVVEYHKPEYWLMENVPGLCKYFNMQPLMTVNLTKTMKRTFWGNVPLFLLPFDTTIKYRLKADIQGPNRSHKRAEIPFHVSYTLAVLLKNK